MKHFLIGALIFATCSCGVAIKKEPDQVTLEENEQGELEEKVTTQPVEVSVTISILPERKAAYPYPIQGFPNQNYTPGGPYVMLSY